MSIDINAEAVDFHLSQCRAAAAMASPNYRDDAGVTVPVGWLRANDKIVRLLLEALAEPQRANDIRTLWAVVRAAGGQVTVRPHHVHDAPDGVLHTIEDPRSGGVVYRAATAKEGE